MIELAPVAAVDTMLREQLLERKQRLRSAQSQNLLDGDVSRLLGEVDAALARFDNGTFGVCEECHTGIEPERLVADPLIRLCLGDLTQKQLDALQEDLQLAAEIQKRLLPKPDLASDFWQANFAYHPAGIVSGDYVDVIPHDGELYFILGDVSGKGMAASILMSNLHAMFHALIPLGLEVCELTARANRLFAESTLANQYATLIVGKMNANGEVEMCNAGHLTPIIVGGEQSVELGSTGLPLGMFSDSSFVSSGVRLAPGETLLLFTDGVTEANDHDGIEFGTERLRASINGSANGHPTELLQTCVNAVAAFRNGSARNDDLTMLALKYTGTTRAIS
ncbi:MAG TPA: SpoIIE family protein phosphatase [Pyrinomonadaceae bacterium]|nr:SpoIIE family protein phosphatase [Pyrinomonadaceae bacterium]